MAQQPTESELALSPLTHSHLVQVLETGSFLRNPWPSSSIWACRVRCIIRSSIPHPLIVRTNPLANWQVIDLSTMTFPGEFKIDYVRVYQRKNEVNIGCDPKDCPTAKYINDHLEAYMSTSCREIVKMHRADPYTDPNMTEWRWPKPRNRLVRLLQLRV